MLFATIATPFDLNQIPDAVDGVELRLDCSPNLVNNSNLQTLLTLRSIAHGGKFQGNREEALEKLLELKPAFLDVEHDVDPTFIEKALKSPSKIILSYHNFHGTPDLDALYKKMSQFPAYSYKIAAYAESSSDAFRMLLFAKAHKNVSVICMGECGQFARVLGPVVENPIDYACIEAPSAPGQLSAHELHSIYRYPKLNPETALYGLIGNPVSQSLGHIFHNEIFASKDLNAVYVKMEIQESELPTLFAFIKQFNFRGLSVTMPLKEKILPYLDVIDPKAALIGAVNTVRIQEGISIGKNTDGIGALEVLGSVKGKHIVLLGAGGAARAIAFEAKSQGALLTILNRSQEKARALALVLNCSYGSLSEVPAEYDILINCTPNPMPIDPAKIHYSALVMDVCYNPKETLLLEKARQLGCLVFNGEQMFKAQAKAQSDFWV